MTQEKERVLGDSKKNHLLEKNERYLEEIKHRGKGGEEEKDQDREKREQKSPFFPVFIF